MSMFPFGGFSVMGILMTIVPIIIIIMFALIIGLAISRSVRGARRWREDNDSPVLTVDAFITGKRMDVSNRHHAGANNTQNYYSTTEYYVTFEVPSGSRMEMNVPDTEFGLLAEGDKGRLTFQGIRYLGFERVPGV